MRFAYQAYKTNCSGIKQCLMRCAYQAYKTICSGIKQCLMRYAYQAYKSICSGIKQCLMRFAYQAYKTICSGIKQCLMRCAYQAYKTICSGIRPTYAIYPVGRIRVYPASDTALRCRNKQLAQLMQLVTDCRGLFKFEILRVLHHLPFQLVNLLLQRFWRHIQFDNLRLRACA